MRKHRVSIQNRAAVAMGTYGLDSGGISWVTEATVWAAVDWAKGMRSLNAGSIDAYAVVMVRMNYNTIVNMRSRIVYQDTTYQILPETFHADMQANIIQFNAQAVINENETNENENQTPA